MGRGQVGREAEVFSWAAVLVTLQGGEGEGVGPGEAVGVRLLFTEELNILCFFVGCS